jgi:uncharacterized protein YbjQ (UPF0145 family)
VQEVPIIISTSDSIPGKNIVDVIGDVFVKRTVWFEDDKGKMIEMLKREAEDMGANAVVNMVHQPSGFWGSTESCSGLAVKIEAFSVQGQKQGDSIFCTECGEQLPKDSKYCSHCGANLST